MTRSIKRATAIAAFAAVAAFAIPGAVHAVPSAPGTVTVTTGINTATFTISLPVEESRSWCNGPWVHTAENAELILSSPTLDIANNPENWFVNAPLSPGGQTVVVRPGDTETSNMLFILDGSYVAGTACYTSPVVPGGQYELFLIQTPFTVGNPKPEPGGVGSLGSLNFGS